MCFFETSPATCEIKKILVNRCFTSKVIINLWIFSLNKFLKRIFLLFQIDFKEKQQNFKDGMSY